MKKKKKKKIIVLVILTLLLIGGGIFSYFYFNKGTVALPKVKTRNLKIVDLKSNERPIAVMIDNNVGNESHAGLQDSYINYEIIVEGGLTRIMAVFKDKDVDLIGPVRSSRHYFLDYALENDALYAHYGWSTFAQNDIKSLGVDNLNGITNAPNAYWRDNNIAAPHNVFTSTAKIYEQAKILKYNTKSEDWLLLNYSFDEVSLAPKEDDTNNDDKSIVANKVVIPYSNSQTRSYQYDADKKVYLRFMNNKPHMDKTTREQLYYKNIIIEQVENNDLDSEGRQDLNTVSSGSGYYITNGYAKEIKWTKATRSGKIKYTYLDGSKVKVNDGNTFIQVQPVNFSTSFE